MVTINRPGILDTDRGIYWFVLAVVAAGVVIVEILRVSRLGRTLRRPGGGLAGQQV